MSVRMALALLILLAASTCGAAVYKWQDAEGRVHYGERPPAETNELSEVRVEQGGDRPDPLLERHRRKQQRFLDSREEERAIRQRRQAEKQAEEAEKSLACDQARQALRQLQGGYRLYTKDDDGNRHFVSDEERERAREEAHRWIRQNCR